jgi:triacylglycerol lipase
MTDAVDYGLLAMYAEDMYSADAPTNSQASLYPTADPRITAAGWTIVSYLTAQDVLLPQSDATDRTMGIDHGRRVFYGFLARNTANPPGQPPFVVAIRGTEGFVEWLIDAEFVPIPHPRYPNAQVEQGFWGIYQTMSLADPASGATTHQNATEGVQELVGTNSVLVTGHSLGSALATYFTDDLAARIGAQVSACLFASPRTGDSTWAGLFDSHVQSYQLYNYIIDLVPHVPSLGYATLSTATVLQPDSAEADIRLDLLCNHHVICYCAMIDYAKTTASTTPGSPLDASEQACIMGPYSPLPNSAKALALIVNDAGIASDRAIALLKALHPDAKITLATSNPAVVALGAGSQVNAD